MRELPPADPGIPDDRSATRYLGWLARRTWPSVTGGVVFGIIWMICQALVPAIVGRAIDAGLTGRDGGALLTWSMVLLGIGLVQAGAGVTRHRLAVFNWLAAAYRTIQVAVRQSNRLGSALPRRLDAGEVVAIGTADIAHIGGVLDITARGAAALAAAGADEIVAALPEGLETEVAERGRSFSGGQQQRLRLARALLADPEVLVLVEPTSAVDAHTEARIADRLGPARRGRTTVICSTSPLVLDRADVVLYVEAGRMVAEGTHRELLDGDPGYARTVLRE